MGCRTRVMGNVCDKEKEISFGRGNLSLYINQFYQDWQFMLMAMLINF